MLYNVYRPKRFRDVLGQPAAVILNNFVQRGGNVPHSILLTGTRGVGKTTLARIFARAVNCSGEGIKPCRKCDSCKHRLHPDIIEVDSAVYGSAGDVSDLIHSMRLSPDYEKRVYIFDEAHTLSKKSMALLLKSVEEPRSSSIVFLLTTEPDKIDDALRSRCMCLKLGTLSKKNILRLLVKVAVKEGIETSSNVLSLIADQSRGSARDALSMLEMFLDYGRPVSVEDVYSLLGEKVDTGRLTDYMVLGNSKEALSEISRLCTFYSTKDILDSCIGGMVMRMRDSIEGGKDPTLAIRWMDSLRQAKREFSTSYIPQLPLEIALAQMVFSSTKEDKLSVLLSDWKSVVNTVGDKSSPLLSKLVPVRVKAGKTLVIKKANGGMFKDPDKVAVLVSKALTEFAKFDVGVEVL